MPAVEVRPLPPVAAESDPLAFPWEARAPEPKLLLELALFSEEPDVAAPRWVAELTALLLPEV